MLVDVKHLDQCCKEMETLSAEFSKMIDQVHTVDRVLRHQGGDVYRGICRSLEKAEAQMEEEKHKLTFCTLSMLSVKDTYQKTELSVLDEIEGQPVKPKLVDVRWIDIAKTGTKVNTILYGGSADE